jgi:periplasmic divalent cation tolerance protein
VTDKIVILSTCGSLEEARRVAQHLVEKRVAACVNLVPSVESVYRWEGKIEQSQEVLLVIKSRRDLFSRVRAELASVHSYQVPELIALPVVEGSEGYLAWLDRELTV